MTATRIPDYIQASIHQDAISRVPGFFNASTRDILNELLQNSRRSGATKVEVTATEDSVTVADDGQGITDPSLILAFGGSNWDRNLAEREHPAGMGFYSLARREEVTVRSRAGQGQPWQVRLNPSHFGGTAPAAVERLEPGSIPQGTTVTFNVASQPQKDLQDAARYYPLPVALNGTPLKQRGFLKHAAHTEEWRGIRIGVYPHPARHVLNPYTAEEAYTLNFHGTAILTATLPVVHAIDSVWRVKVDVLDCPELQLTLPARREVMETPFLEEMKTACRRAIYRAMQLKDEPPDLPRQAWREALDLGVTLPEARPRLRLWHPEKADPDAFRLPEKYAAATGDAIVIDFQKAGKDKRPGPPDQQALSRAAGLNGAERRLLAANPDLEGYSWYDRLPKATSVSVSVTDQGKTFDLTTLRLEEEILENGRPERIHVSIHGQDQTGSPFAINLETDVAFENEEEEDMEDNRPIVTASSGISPADLTQLLEDAFFVPSCDGDDDSHYTQQNRHEEASRLIAMSLLQSPEEAAIHAITKAAVDHMYFIVPDGATATITVNRADKIPFSQTVSVSIDAERE